MSSFIALAAQLIRGHEGLRLTAYDDGTGQPIVPGYAVRGHVSIGYGRNLEGRGISAAEADGLFLNDLAYAEEVARAFAGEPVWQELNDARKVAIMDMAHQLGPGGLGDFKRLREALACGNWIAAEAEVLDSLYARQTPSRAARVAEIMLTGKLPL